MRHRGLHMETPDFIEMRIETARVTSQQRYTITGHWYESLHSAEDVVLLAWED